MQYIHLHLRLDQGIDEQRGNPRQRHADGAPHQAQLRRLEQNFGQNIPILGAHGFFQTDLRHLLVHGDHHRIGDRNPAHKDRDGENPTHHREQRRQCLPHRAEQLIRRHDLDAGVFLSQLRAQSLEVLRRSRPNRQTIHFRAAL